MDILNIHGLSIERLKSFCTIIDAGSISNASKVTGIEQSQYSRQMRELARAVGTELFTREGKFLQLTKDGVHLAALTKAFFESISELAGSKQRLLRIGAGESVIRWVLIPQYREIAAAVSAQMRMENHRTHRIVEMLGSGELDIGIIRADAVTKDLESAPFAEIAYELVVPRGLLPEKSAADISDVKRLPMVLIDGDGQFMVAVDQLVKRNKLPVEVVARAESFSLAADMAKVIEAATIVPKQAAKGFPPDDYIKPALKGIDMLTRQLLIVWSKKTADLNTRSSRAATLISRIFTG